MPSVANSQPATPQHADPASQAAQTGRDHEATRAKTPRGIERGAAIVDLPQPVYPRRCIRLGQQGTVILEVQVRATGTVGKIRLRKGSGYRLLDDAAIDAAQAGRFRPATRDGDPVASVLIIPFQFELK